MSFVLRVPVFFETNLSSKSWGLICGHYLLYFQSVVANLKKIQQRSRTVSEYSNPRITVGS